MAVEPQSVQIESGANDYVWVISNLMVPDGEKAEKFVYRESFRGKMIEVPPNREKSVVMRRTAARRFLGQAVPVADPGPSGKFLGPNGEVDPSKFGKPLQTLDMTEVERKTYLGISQEDIEKDAKQVEEDLKNRCSICNWQGYNEHGLKIHMSRLHPDHAALGDAKPEAFKVSKKMPDAVVK